MPDSFSAEVATSAVGEVGELGDGAVLPGTTLEAVVFTSVSTVMKYLKNEEHEFLRLFLKKIPFSLWKSTFLVQNIASGLFSFYIFNVRQIQFNDLLPN